MRPPPFALLILLAAPGFAVHASGARAGRSGPPVRISPEAFSTRHGAVWPRLDVAALEIEDLLRGEGGGPLRIGVNRSVPGGPLDLEEAPAAVDGSGRITRAARLHAPGAKALRLRIALLEIHGDLLVAGESGDPEVYGSEFAGEAPFWTGSLPGETAILEYRPLAGDPRPPRVRIDDISHVYRMPEPQGNAVAPGGAELPCHVDVNCADVPAGVRDSVGLLVFTTFTGTFRCTGTLLEDLDPNTAAGYVLTAQHCIDRPEVAASVEVYWLHQTDVCGGATPPLLELPRSRGSVLLATGEETDFTLLRLRDDPDEDRTFAFWATEESPGEIRTIHHPRGAYKRISVGEPTAEAPICGTHPPSRYGYLDWISGVTEPGSSGSPLLDASWRVVGQLFGTCSIENPGCDNPGDYNALYGRFGVTYPSIAQHLESVAADDDLEDNDSPEAAPAILAGVHALRLVDRDDYFSVVLSRPGSIALEAVFRTADLDLNLELSPARGEPIASSSGTTGTEMISAEVPAGTYIIRATKARRWGGDYTLTLEADTEPPLPDPHFLRGDGNADGALDLSDPIFLLLRLFASGREAPCSDAADVNDDEIIDIADPLHALGWLFREGHPPPPPAGSCGKDPDGDGLYCEEFTPCE